MTARRTIWRLTVHLPCGSVRGMTGYGRQGCPCLPAEPWEGYDVSRAVDLCLVCARGEAGGVTRWSWLGCSSCRSVERALQDWLGMRVLPLGRHSIMNGIARRVTAGPGTHADPDPDPDADADADADAEGEAFARSLNSLGMSWSRLSEWGDAEVRRLTSVAAFDLEDVPLDEWHRTFPESVAASVDAYERLLQIELPRQVVQR